MRYQGKITSWKDDKGFGFITPNGGGDQVFVHIKSFSNRQRRPVGNESVIYELESDGQGRLRATGVKFVGERRTSNSMGESGRGAAGVFAAIFLVIVAAASLMGRLPLIVLGVYLGASVIAFLGYALDKSAAVNDRWRTKESTLHLFALLGGWPGALVAQRLLRHKSKKKSFQYVFWVTVTINCIAFSWLLTNTGVDTLRGIVGTW